MNYLLYYWTSVLEQWSQSFWHQGSFLWKTFFPWTRGGWFQFCSLTHCSPPAEWPSVYWYLECLNGLTDTYQELQILSGCIHALLLLSHYLKICNHLICIWLWCLKICPHYATSIMFFSRKGKKDQTKVLW